MALNPNLLNYMNEPGCILAIFVKYDLYVLTNIQGQSQRKQTSQNKNGYRYLRSAPSICMKIDISIDASLFYSNHFMRMQKRHSLDV